MLSSPVGNEVAPANLIFYISFLKSLNLALIPCAKLDAHWGTWTGCCHFEKDKGIFILLHIQSKSSKRVKSLAVLSSPHHLHRKTSKIKPCWWVMMTLSYILDTFRVNGKTIWFLKHKEDISKLSTFDFGSNFAKALVLLCALLWRQLFSWR